MRGGKSWQSGCEPGKDFTTLNLSWISEFPCAVISYRHPIVFRLISSRGSSTKNLESPPLASVKIPRLEILHVRVVLSSTRSAIRQFHRFDALNIEQYRIYRYLDTGISSDRGVDDLRRCPSRCSSRRFFRFEKKMDSHENHARK